MTTVADRPEITRQMVSDTNQLDEQLRKGKPNGDAGTRYMAVVTNQPEITKKMVSDTNQPASRRADLSTPASIPS